MQNFELLKQLGRLHKPILLKRGLANTIEELLAGGKAQKGDVIYFEPVSWEEEDADCHIGFFWGDNSNDNRFWHSASIKA